MINTSIRHKRKMMAHAKCLTRVEIIFFDNDFPFKLNEKNVWIKLQRMNRNERRASTSSKN